MSWLSGLKLLLSGATRRRVGFWRSGSEPWLPDVRDFVDAAWDERERVTVVRYLRDAPVVEAYYGESTCRLCGDENGCKELGDVVYVWPDGLAHYVEAHNVRPPMEFVAHALARVGGR